MRQIFYVRPQEDRSWVVSRVGHPLAVSRSPDEAVRIGNRIARKASTAGLEAELRLSRPDRSYDLYSTFADGRGLDL